VAPTLPSQVSPTSTTPLPHDLSGATPDPGGGADAGDEHPAESASTTPMLAASLSSKPSLARATLDEALPVSLCELIILRPFPFPILSL
jgi:hypothetical protein